MYRIYPEDARRSFWKQMVSNGGSNGAPLGVKAAYERLALGAFTLMTDETLPPLA